MKKEIEGLSVETTDQVISKEPSYPFKLTRRELIKDILLVGAGLAVGCGRNEPISPGTSTPVAPQASQESRPSPTPQIEVTPLAAVDKNTVDTLRKKAEGTTITFDKSTSQKAAQAKLAEAGLTAMSIPYFGNKEVAGSPAKLRRLKFSPETSSTLYDMYVKNPETLTYPMPTHPAVLVEFGFIEYLAKIGKTKRDQYLLACADGAVAGFEQAYAKNIGKAMVVALEAGHMSYPLPIKNASGKEVKVTNDDARSPVTLPEGGTYTERDLNLKLCQLIALKLLNRQPKWIPILNSDEMGYPAKQIFYRRSNTEMEAADAIFPMKYKWDQLAILLKKAGVDMTRLAVHFDSGTHNNGRDGMIITPSDDVNKTCENLANIYAPAIQKSVRAVVPEYKCWVNTEYDKGPMGPLATLRYSTQLSILTR